MPTIFSSRSISTTRSTRTKGNRWGMLLSMALMSSMVTTAALTLFSDIRQLLVEAPHQAPEFRELRQQRHDLEPLLVGRGGQAAGKHRSGRDRLRHSGLRADGGTVADGDVVHDPHLSRQGNPASHARAPGNTRLGGDH